MLQKNHSKTKRKSTSFKSDCLENASSHAFVRIHPASSVSLVVLCSILALFLPHCDGQSAPETASPPLDLWQTTSGQRPLDMANIVDLDVMCGKQHMEVTLTFDRPFNGIVFSKGAVDRYNCIYVTPQTGETNYKFNILYNECGSKPDLNGRFYENNIVVQYDKDLIEVWDEAKRLRCEWYNDYEKGVTKAPIRVSDLDVVELNFRGDNVDCWMEIQVGKGPWASPVNGIVPLGTTLTMVVGIDDREGEFDMRVKSCEAGTGGVSRPIRLSDENGCVLRPKMISKFMKMRSTDNRATVVTYAFFHAFKFPDSLAVHIQCKVEICRFGCPDHCQSPANYVAREQLEVSANLNQQQHIQRRHEFKNLKDLNSNSRIGGIYAPPQPLKQEQRSSPSNGLFADFVDGIKKLPKLSLLPSIFGGSVKETERTRILDDEGQPRVVVPVNHRSESNFLKAPQPLVYPSSFNAPLQLPVFKPIEDLKVSTRGSSFPYGPRSLKLDDVQPESKRTGKKIDFSLPRRRRSTESEAELGVQSGYQVVSKVDFDFDPNEENNDGVDRRDSPDGSDVFQSRIQEDDVVLGICLPSNAFSVIFILLALLTVVSVLVTGLTCYHRTLEKVSEKGPPIGWIRGDRCQHQR